MTMQSGISNVPTELLTKIFRLSVPQPLVISPHVTSDHLPWALLGVCRRWRHIVTEMPELWKNIEIEYDFEGDSLAQVPETNLNTNYVMRIAQETLLRSGNAPLSLNLTSQVCDVDNQTSLINCVVHHSHRIKKLSLNLLEDTLFNLLSMPPLNFDCLEFVSIWCFDGPNQAVSCSVFDKASLKFAELESFYWMPKLARSRSTHLTHLSISQEIFTPGQAHKILKQFPGLIFLQISLCYLSYDSEGKGISSLPVFPSLQILFVNFYEEPELLSKFFKPLILPNLTHLEITSSETQPQIGDSAWDCSSVFTIVSSFRQLTTFRITYPIAEDYDMDSFLLTLPNIVNLGLPEISQQTLRSIYSGELVPGLRIFQIQQKSQTCEMYLDMIKNRLRGDFLTLLVFPHYPWRGSLEEDTTEEIERLERGFTDQGLLRVDYFSEETYVPMEKFLSPDFKLWDPMDLRNM